MTPPIQIYIKENGYLGLLGYDSDHDRAVFCSKSLIGGKFSVNFQNIFLENHARHLESITEELKTQNINLVFEVIDPVEDPHIIQYPAAKIVLLDIFYRTLEEKKFSYEDLQTFAAKYNFECKKLHAALNSKEEFENFLKSDEVKTAQIEGWVAEDSVSNRWKIKSEYYSFWKWMRKIKDDVSGRRRVNLASLFTQKHNDVYGFMLKIPVDKLAQMSIIDVRNEFENSLTK